MTQIKQKPFKQINNKKPLPQKPDWEIVSIHQFSKIAMTFWLGGSWMLCLVMFPILFKTLDQITASELVGQILNIVAYIGIVCLSIALIEVIVIYKFSLAKSKNFWYIMLMTVILIINNFAIFPVIHNLRKKLAALAHQIISVQNNVFDFWHSFSAILFISICVIGVLYLLEI